MLTNSLYLCIGLAHSKSGEERQRPTQSDQKSLEVAVFLPEGDMLCSSRKNWYNAYNGMVPAKGRASTRYCQAVFWKNVYGGISVTPYKAILSTCCFLSFKANSRKIRHLFKTKTTTKREKQPFTGQPVWGLHWAGNSLKSLAKASLCNSGKLQNDVFQNHKSQFLPCKFVSILDSAEETENL